MSSIMSDFHDIFIDLGHLVSEVRLFLVKTSLVSLLIQVYCSLKEEVLISCYVLVIRPASFIIRFPRHDLKRQVICETKLNQVTMPLPFVIVLKSEKGYQKGM